MMYKKKKESKYQTLSQALEDQSPYKTALRTLHFDNMRTLDHYKADYTVRRRLMEWNEEGDSASQEPKIAQSVFKPKTHKAEEIKELKK